MSTTETNSPHTARDAAWLAYDAYVFDIDGTLLNSRDLVHYRAFQAALLEVYGCTRDISEVPLQGNTDPGILRATLRLCGIGEQTFLERLPEALACMRRTARANVVDFRIEVCPSIPRMLESLRSRDKLIGVATGNLEEIGWPKLAAAGLRQFFDFGSFSDEHELRTDIFRNAVREVRRRLGAQASVCFVGDTPNDISAAKANDCPIIAVATGIHPLKELSPLSPDFCVGCCDELFS